MWKALELAKSGLTFHEPWFALHSFMQLQERKSLSTTWSFIILPSHSRLDNNPRKLVHCSTFNFRFASAIVICLWNFWCCAVLKTLEDKVLYHFDEFLNTISQLFWSKNISHSNKFSTDNITQLNLSHSTRGKQLFPTYSSITATNQASIYWTMRQRLDITKRSNRMLLHSVDISSNIFISLKYNKFSRTIEIDSTFGKTIESSCVRQFQW